MESIWFHGACQSLALVGMVLLNLIQNVAYEY